ncbi:hypothetical protein K439DRAFT_1357021 [Ramaria rubella]|nr:hypothetical protein K439DRAFT_1357021 [Ramaria rubella]
MPAVNVEFHFHEWLDFLHVHVYCHELQGDDFIFPSVNSKGLVQPGLPISHDTIQKWLDEFVAAASIKIGNGQLTTHCF